MSYILGGAIPSPPDERDHKITSIMDVPRASYFPKEYEVWVSPVKAQGPVNNCVPHAFALPIEGIRHAITGEFVPVSTDWLYGHRPEGYWKGEGMIPRDCASTCVKQGACDKVDCYFTGWLDVPIAIDRIMNNLSTYLPLANKFKVPEYVALSDADSIKAFMMQYPWPVPVTISVNKTFRDADASVDVIHQNYDYTSLGSHEIAIYGWNEDGWKIQNSWDTYWANNGRAVLSYDYALGEKWGLKFTMPDVTSTYTDIADNYWGKQAIQTATDDGIFAGMPGNKFCPDEPMTRVQMAVCWERIKTKVGELIAEARFVNN